MVGASQVDLNLINTTSLYFGGKIPGNDISDQIGRSTEMQQPTCKASLTPIRGAKRIPPLRNSTRLPRRLAIALPQLLAQKVHQRRERS